jgi:23S rRNA pseudouridine2605 synthase
VTEPGARFSPNADIRVDGKPISKPERKRTIVVYKPVGVVTTMSDPFGETTVADIVKTPERLVPVGRLDRDSEGLLIMSNDGSLVNRLTHPRFGHKKTYIVKTAGRWSEEKLSVLRSPITLDDGYTIRPVPVEVLRVNSNNTQLLRFVLSEGRKRQIRKMCSAAHLVVLSLKRVAVGSFPLPDELKPGMWRILDDREIEMLFQ